MAKMLGNYCLYPIFTEYSREPRELVNSLFGKSDEPVSVWARKPKQWAENRWVIWVYVDFQIVAKCDQFTEWFVKRSYKINI